MSDPDYMWTSEAIKEWYDNHPNMTLRELSTLTGYPVSYLKNVLLEK